MSFRLDLRLARDTDKICDLDLCYLGLMNDARFPWLVLVPRIEDVVEIVDLSGNERARLWQEIEICSDVLKEQHSGCKLNIGMLGNIVSQLHVHIIARFDGDATWPGPVWGAGTAVDYERDQSAATRSLIEDRLGQFKVI